MGGDLDNTWTTVAMCDTRMNLAADYIMVTRKQHDFLKLLWGNDVFRAYFRERLKKVKDSSRTIVERCNDNSRWERMDTLTSSVLVHFNFKRVHGLTSRANFPQSSFVILVQGLRNDLN